MGCIRPLWMHESMLDRQNPRDGSLGCCQWDEDMTEEISKEVFAHLVELASFELELDNAEYLRTQMNNQLKAIHELEAISFDEKIEPSLHGVQYPPANCPPTRDDEWIPFKEIEKLTGQMPQFEDGYVIVPDIPHQILE